MIDRILYSMIYDMQRQDHRVYKAPDCSGLLIDSPQSPLWLWLRDDRRKTDAQLFFRRFMEKYPGSLNGLVARCDVALACAQLYAKKTGCGFTSHELVAYYLPVEVNLRQTEGGFLRLANQSDMPHILKWINDFYEEALGRRLPSDLAPRNPHGIISDSARLFVWCNAAGMRVSMGMISTTIGRTCRFNLIYTPARFRKRGYGKAIVTGLALKVRESQIPMLYTDGSNINANKLYLSIGFKEAGRLREIRFTPTANA